MSPAGLHAFWRRTTETLQHTPVRATCTDAAAKRDLRDLALKCCLETRDMDQAREITETMSVEDGESPNILLKKASVLGLLVRYEEARDILLRLNQDFPGRPQSCDVWSSCLSSCEMSVRPLRFQKPMPWPLRTMAGQVSNENGLLHWDCGELSMVLNAGERSELPGSIRSDERLSCVLVTGH
jgi:hypothetical protein